MTHLLVFGSNGPTGRLVVRQALDEGHHVGAVTRRPQDYPITSPQLEVLAADVTDALAVERILAAAATGVVISTYGVPYSFRAITVYSTGIANITRAMASHGVERLVCVSSTTLSTREAPGESLYWRKVVIPLLRNTFGRTLYDDMSRMEDIVRRSVVDWTIVRPGGLFNAADPTGDYLVSTQRLPGRYTSRADLAHLLIAEATAPQHSRAVIEVLTRSASPSPTAFIREALGRNY